MFRLWVSDDRISTCCDMLVILNLSDLFWLQMEIVLIYFEKVTGVLMKIQGSQQELVDMMQLHCVVEGSEQSVHRMQLLFVTDVLAMPCWSFQIQSQWKETRVRSYNAVAAHVAVVICRMQKGSSEKRQSGYALVDSSTDFPMESQGELLQQPLPCLHQSTN